MYINSKKMTHIVNAESRGMIMQDFVEQGDTLCMIISGLRNDGRHIGNRWFLSSTAAGKLCKNCLSIERK